MTAPVTLENSPSLIFTLCNPPLTVMAVAQSRKEQPANPPVKSPPAGLVDGSWSNSIPTAQLEAINSE